MTSDCILRRRSVRAYTDEPVSDEDIRTLVRAGLSGPSAMNTRSPELLVLQDRNILTEAAKICQYWGPLGKAPLGILVLGSLRAKNAMEVFVVQDCSAASENILCEAAQLGLGGVWLGLYGVPERVMKTRGLFSLPDDILPVSFLALGHPEKQPEPHEDFDPGRIHYGKY